MQWLEAECSVNDVWLPSIMNRSGFAGGSNS
jgi:hypothetical protein